MGSKEQILRAFIILKNPGCGPQKKGPFTSDELLHRFMEEVKQHRPDAEVTVCRLTWDFDLWVESGREYWEFRQMLDLDA